VSDLLIKLVTYALVYIASAAYAVLLLMAVEWLLERRKRPSETLTDQDHQHTTRSTNLVRIEVRSERM
jgi:membrane protein implicated in regulation of membrane protease activity